MDQEVPIAEKALLTIREAADYYNLGLHKLRELTRLFYGMAIRD